MRRCQWSDVAQMMASISLRSISAAVFARGFNVFAAQRFLGGDVAAVVKVRCRHALDAGNGQRAGEQLAAFDAGADNGESNAYPKAEPAAAQPPGAQGSRIVTLAARPAAATPVPSLMKSLRVTVPFFIRTGASLRKRMRKIENRTASWPGQRLTNQPLILPDMDRGPKNIMRVLRVGTL